MASYSRWFEEIAGIPEELRGTRGGRACVLPAGEAVFAKRRDEPRARTLVYALLGRPARSARSFRLGLALAAAGVPTARPLALIERRERGEKWESVLVLERLRGTTLRDVLLGAPTGEGDEAASDAERREIRRAAAEAIARFHRAGFRQRDLKAANLLVTPSGEEGGRVRLVDFEGMTQLRAPPIERVRRRDLARLGVSFRASDVRDAGTSENDWRELIVDYLTAYAGEAPHETAVRAWLDGSERWAERKIRRNLRRRRPIT